MVIDGVAARSRYRADPPIHILVGDRHEVWCSGGPGLRENTPNRVRCGRCTSLLREGVAEGFYSQEELDDWMASTRNRRIFGVGRPAHTGQEHEWRVADPEESP